MTNRVELPDDDSFVQVTDGTNSAWITGGHIYVGTDTPDKNSATQPVPSDGAMISSPAIVWVRKRGRKGQSIIVSKW